MPGAAVETKGTHPQVVGSLVSAVPGTDPLAALTEREREILELMAQGLTNAGIARRLVHSDRTVEAHIRHLFQKIGVSDRQDDHRRALTVLTDLSARS
ncbi:MAG TPA: helix-turn-helix transcriptional regulator [Anaerolineales bacterium]|nr:helix-turn-helix transcriptional regulator [Anaerolineales bacterium]